MANLAKEFKQRRVRNPKSNICAFCVDAELERELREHCAREDISFSSAVRQALIFYLASIKSEDSGDT